MATTAPSQANAPLQANAPPSSDAVADRDEAAVERALVLAAQTPAEERGIKLTAAVARLPVELDVAVPVRDFRGRNLLALQPGKVIETQWAHGADMPLASGEVQLAWSEFEVVDSQLAVRVTRLV